MALYAFDGTGNEVHDVPGKNSNVHKLRKVYEKNYQPVGRSECIYQEGVGTRWSFLGMFFGSIFGAGGGKRLKRAHKQCEKNFDHGDEVIDIIGFSRGAALAIEFANMVRDKGISGNKDVPIRFLGIWDTVASFGFPGNNINLGHKLSLPTKVDHCYHALALDERRRMFPLTRVTKNASQARDQHNVHELWFRGYHSDVGGGNQNMPRSNIALNWMLHRARDHGLPITDADIDAVEFDIHAPCRKPKMDRVENDVRQVHQTDLIHESVMWTEMADTFSANNPPENILIVGNDGDILAGGFQHSNDQQIA